MKEMLEAEGNCGLIVHSKKSCMNSMNMLPANGRLSGSKLRKAMEIAWKDIQMGNDHGFEITEKEPLSLDNEEASLPQNHRKWLLRRLLLN